LGIPRDKLHSACLRRNGWRRCWVVSWRETTRQRCWAYKTVLSMPMQTLQTLQTLQTSDTLGLCLKFTEEAETCWNKMTPWNCFTKEVSTFEALQFEVDRWPTWVPWAWIASWI
jgi:hypothetical protein